MGRGVEHNRCAEAKAFIKQAAWQIERQIRPVSMHRAVLEHALHNLKQRDHLPRKPKRPSMTSVHVKSQVSE
eukprot:7047713-Prymnesium_polylepis.1